MGATKTTDYTIQEMSIAKYAKAFSHPARVAILNLLLKKQACVCGDIVDELPLSQSTVSQHLKELKEVGLIKGDIIKKIDTQIVTSYAELNGYISTKRPNDQVQVTIIRNNKTIIIPVTLTKSDVINTQFKGLDLENINATDKKKFRISYGVKIKEINNEKLSAYANDLKGGIILSIGNIKAIDVETVSKALSNLDENQAVQIEMLTTNGQVIRLIL